MVTINEIRDLKDYLVTNYHLKRLKEQKADETYIQDTFEVPFIKDAVDAVRTGKGFRMVNAPAEHIITSSPQVFRSGKRKETEADKRLASELNRWARVLLHQNPQPYKEYVKKLLGRGEGWIYVIHNNKFESSDPNKIPIDFIVLDPMIVFGDTGEINGVPPRVLIYCERIASKIKQDYPHWNGAAANTRVPLLMYFDDKVRYFEAAQKPLLTDSDGEPSNGDGIQENIYGMVPFVHSYSGFGSGSIDGDPAYLAVSRIRYCRDLIAEYSAIKSVVNHLIFQYAYTPMDLLYDPAMWTPPKDFAENYNREPDSFNLVPMTPGGALKRGVDMLPSQELFQHLAKIESDIDREDPLGRIAETMGTSGRQQLAAEDAGLRRYDTIVENTQHAFETAFGMGLKIIEKVEITDNDESLYPDGIKKGDIGENYEVRIELKAEDPVANQIKGADGDRKWQAGIIDAETNLTQYQGYTLEEAQKIIDSRTVEDIVLHDPVIRRTIAVQIAKEMGMEQQYNDIESQLGQINQGLSTAPQIGSQGGEPRVGNIKTQTGAEMPDMSLQMRPQRSSPVG